MKTLNRNRAELYLLFTREPIVKLSIIELAYFEADDGRTFGMVAGDRVDIGMFHALLFARDSQHVYRMVDCATDLISFDEAKEQLQRMMDVYGGDVSLNRGKPRQDFFKTVVKADNMHPFFKELRDNPAHSAAKAVIQELSYQFEDKDNNFVDQFQSKNGFDARMWELYLRCYLREENFTIDSTHAAPDYMVEKLGDEVAIEATIVSHKGEINIHDWGFAMRTIPDIQEQLKNDVPLLYGSALYSKMQHKTKYWDMAHVKGKPFVIAIADFHENMSMVWSMNGLISILYGVMVDMATMTQKAGFIFKKGETDIAPLFLEKDNENVSAVMFSAVGTIAKFDRMGMQAGLGDGKSRLLVHKIYYNEDEEATMPDHKVDFVSEKSRERWGDGMMIFHNPFAKIPLDRDLFPHASHNYFEDGNVVSYSKNGEHILMSAQMVNLRIKEEGEL